jgi:hypothetical protein
VTAAEIIGIFFQVAGTAIAAWALSDNLRNYGDGRGLIPPLTRAAVSVRRLLGRLPHQTVTPNPIPSGSGTGTLTVRGRVEIAADAPVGEQIAYLRNRFEEQQTDFERLRSALGGTRHQLREELGVMASESAQRDQQLRADLARVAAGSARAELLGLFLVVVGTFVSALG